MKTAKEIEAESFLGNKVEQVLEDLKNWISDEIGGNTLIIAPETYFSESPGFVINDFYESRFTKSLSSLPMLNAMLESLKDLS